MVIVSIAQAQAEARRLRSLTEQGKDPRELERQQAALKADQDALHQRNLEARNEKEKCQLITVDMVWQGYIEKRRPFWSPITRFKNHSSKLVSI